MWAKFSSALRSTTSRFAQDEPQPSTQLNHGQSQNQNQNQNQDENHARNQSQTEVMARVLEQHPNLSLFHHNDNTAPRQSPPPSPSKRALFKRLSKDPDSVRGPTSSLKLLPKKIRGNLPFGNASQTSLASPIVETHQASADEPPTKHKTQASQDTIRSFASILRRPSLDLLRSVTQESSSSRPSIDSSVDKQHSSVRSILRDPKTPGTGQNVRFFSRDAYKVISPEESTEEKFLSPPEQLRLPDHVSFVDRLNQTGSVNTSTPVTRVSSPGSKSRPSLNGVFGPLETARTKSEADVQSPTSEGSGSMSLSGPLSPPNFNANGSLDLPKPLELPDFPPGLGFDVSSPLLGSAIDLDLSLSTEGSAGTQMTSTPFKPPGVLGNSKGKEKEGGIKEEESKEEKGKESILVEPVTGPKTVDETIFHAKERPPVFSPLHERSQSFSFGQTVFHSMGKSSSAGTLSPAYPSSDNVRPSEDGSAVRSSTGTGTPSSASKPRTRAMSDTVFQSMLKDSPAGLNKPPEADINDESSRELMLYAHPVTEPDPFNANANTYYTPQTMIPTTPPPGFPRHTRKTSKEESLIYSLQAQLALQTELCSQYEADLRTKDEMVELLGRKVADMEKQENQKKNALRQWKRKVQELERAVRMLEEEVDCSRQESMERSVMDEASGEALRMLHRQIASLEREKKEWEKREQSLKEEVETLGVIVKERSEDVNHLKEMLWSRDEELDHGLREAKEQIDMLGNISLVGVDEEELRRLAEKEQKAHEEKQAYHAAQMGWEQERAELMMKLESVQVEKTKVEEQLDMLKQQMKTKEEEFDVMKNELEAQWGHSEVASERIQQLEKAKSDAEESVAKLEREKEEVVQERNELAQRYEEVEQRVGNLELEWNESENRKMQLESEFQEVWELKEAMEKEREELEEQLQQERGHSEALTHALHQCEDRIAQLEQEQQFTSENVTRLEENLRRRDEEIAEYSQKVRAQELEAENLREELGKLKREHAHVLNEQSRALKEATGSEGEARKQLQDLVRQKAETDVELKSTKDRWESLKNEMERLRKHVRDLQQESADKEVKIVQFTKQHAQDKEDIQGLNIALDAKQQELELYKRKFAIKTGSAGTPASSVSSKVQQRRDSSVFDNTPSASRPPSRATSVVSDSGSAKAENNKVSALGKSNRINALNGTSTTGSAVKKRVEGSMGPPPVKPRSSLSSTPSPAARPSALARSVSKPQNKTATTPVPHRRVASGTLDKAKSRPSAIMSPTSSISELSEKENVDSETITVRRRNPVPTSV